MYFLESNNFYNIFSAVSAETLHSKNMCNQRQLNSRCKLWNSWLQSGSVVNLDIERINQGRWQFFGTGYSNFLKVVRILSSVVPGVTNKKCF